MTSKAIVAVLAAFALFAAVCLAGPLFGAIEDASTSEAINGPVDGIPAQLLAAYSSAAEQAPAFAGGCQGMRWQILAGVAQVESTNAAGHAITPNGDVTLPIIGPRLDGSGAGGNHTPVRDTDHGRWDGDPVFDHAVGPFQMLPATFASIASRIPSAAAGGPSPNNADDEALAAAIYLCGGGRNLADRAQLQQALYEYNNSAAYVAEVMGWIDQYDQLTANPGGIAGGSGQTVLAAALAKQGVPYSWGGGTASGPSRGVCCSPGGQDGSEITGFDCSGLTLYTFAQAGVRLPRTAADQAAVGQRIPASAGYGALQPGDLVFYAYIPGQDSTIFHVGIYLGAGQIVDAARPGTTVRIDPIGATSGYAGGARIV